MVNDTIQLLDKLLPLLGVTIGWAGAELSKYFSHRKNNKSKLKHLLYNLLEIRWQLKRELEFNRDFLVLFKKVKSKLEDYSVYEADKFEASRKLAHNALEKLIKENSQLYEIESNTDKVINELSRINPLLAYELKGNYSLKEKFQSMEAYINDMERYFQEEDKNIVDTVTLDLSYDAINDLESYILKIAKMIGYRTLQKTKVIINKNSMVNSEVIENFELYIEKHLKTINNTQ